MARKKAAEHAHHGGGWKIAYADFITTMMAFFLLLWLLAVTTEDQRKGIEDYFSGVIDVMSVPTIASDSAKSSESTSDTMTQGSSEVAAEDTNEDGELAFSEAKKEADAGQQMAITGEGGNSFTGESRTLSNKNHASKMYQMAEQKIVKAARENPHINEMARHLTIDEVEEGLRIQVIDQDNEPLFANGSADMYEKTQQLLKFIGSTLAKLPNHIKISGHTDANPFSRGSDYTNWELSFDRANASRKALTEAGIPAYRIMAVEAKEATELLVPEEPYSSRNRRITITLLKTEEQKKEEKNG